MTVLLAIDQGTTSTRAILFDPAGGKLGTAQRELPQSYPQPGWVEHDAEQIWQDTLACVREVLQSASLRPADIAGLGIANQRETTVIWDRASGKPIHPAIVWQDRRTATFCQQHAERDDWIADRTGLLLDPYFSATKIAWILDHVDGARSRAARGELAFGTIDSWLIWNLTGGKQHVTDATNASRTCLYNPGASRWDPELLEFFDVPRELLPRILDSATHFGDTDAALLGGSLSIHGVAGDQQAATVGQACFHSGMAKSTYGTGCFVVLNTGTELTRSSQRLLSTIAYQLNGTPHYALEGSIFVAGAAVQWLRDAMRLIDTAGETEALARSVTSTQGVYLVPAFTGLGAPYWDPDARGAILGLTRDSGIAHIVRAALESVCFQTRDLMEAMAQDAPEPKELRVDGGMAANDWLVQGLTDMLRIPVVRPQTIETTALGAAYLAGLSSGVYGSLDEIERLWEADLRVQPALDSGLAQERYNGWKAAVARVRSDR